MSGRVIAVLFSTILIFSSSAFSQCDYQLLYSGQYRASIFDLWADGNDLWAATGYGLNLYDRSIDPPRLLATVRIAAMTRLVRARDGVAYAAGSAGVSVVRRNGNSLQLVRTLAVGAVNDLLLQPGTMFAATPSGIVAFDLLDPLSPTRSAASFPTSNPNVTSIAVNGSTLFAADGDSSLESFSIVVPASPQPAGSIQSLPRSATIKALAGRLYVSDGQRTETFAPTGTAFSSLGTFPYAATSAADAGGNVLFVAGNDRQLRALDVSIPQNYVELFGDELLPTAGNVNRVTALQIAGGRLYAGGGDIGLSTYDLSRFRSPFPMRVYGTGTTTSVAITSSAIYGGRPGTGILEMTRSSSGALVPARQWSADIETVQDAGSGFVLSSTGAVLKLWGVASSTPSLIARATFRASIRSAFLRSGLTVVTLLNDGTLWTADMTQAAPLPVRMASGVSGATLLAAADPAVVAVEIASTGTTTLHSWSGDLSLPPVDTTISGAVTAVAVNGPVVAAFNFRGVTVLNGGSQTILSGSNTAIATALKIAGGKVIALTDGSRLRIWDLSTARLEKEYNIPGGPVAIDADRGSTAIAVATGIGQAIVNYATSSTLPSPFDRTGGNAYYRKAAATAGMLYLFDGQVIEAYEIGSGIAPLWVWSIPAPGVIDLAASGTSLYTLTSNQTISAYSVTGLAMRSATLAEGSDVAPLSIHVVAGAPWVSFSRGCTTTGCEKRTNVLDPQSLLRTASLSGGVVDAAERGTNVYAIFDLPSEIRVYSTADNAHPTAMASRATTVNPLAVAASDGNVYLLADRVYAFSDLSLTPAGEHLTALTPGPTARLIIDSGCATITGRSATASTYGVPQWNAAEPMAVPGAVRTLALTSGRLLFLTDYAIEVWSRGTGTNRVRRHSVRP